MKIDTQNDGGLYLPETWNFLLMASGISYRRGVITYPFLVYNSEEIKFGSMTMAANEIMKCISSIMKKEEHGKVINMPEVLIPRNAMPMLSSDVFNPGIEGIIRKIEDIKSFNKSKRISVSTVRARHKFPFNLAVDIGEEQRFQMNDCFCDLVIKITPCDEKYLAITTESTLGEEAIRTSSAILRDKIETGKNNNQASLAIPPTAFIHFGGSGRTTNRDTAAKALIASLTYCGGRVFDADSISLMKNKQYQTYSHVFPAKRMASFTTCVFHL